MRSGRIALFAAALGACTPERSVSIEPGSRRIAAPSPNDVGTCIDVGESRACYGGGVRRVERNLPRQRAPVRGWRCAGQGAARVCEDRAWGSSAFVCSDDACVQRHPRMPDDGEWECADIDGAVICHGGLAAAGTVAGPADEAWLCGARRTHDSDRVCVDFSPDRPARFQDCRFEQGRRVCRAGEAKLGRACDSCPAGSVCTGGHCLPLEPKPECWLTKDCAAGVCLYGTCRGGA